MTAAETAHVPGLSLSPRAKLEIAGIHEAFSIAVGSTFWIGILGALIAAAAVLTLKEVRLLTTFEMAADEGTDVEDGLAHEPTGGVLPAGD